MACYYLTLSLSTLANAFSTGHPLIDSLHPWTWDVPNLIRDAEEADGDA